jgi:hypothetical protein
MMTSVDRSATARMREPIIAPPARPRTLHSRGNQSIHSIAASGWIGNNAQLQGRPPKRNLSPRL